MFQSLRSRLLFSHILITGLVLTLVAVSLLIFLISSPVVDRLALQRLETIAVLTAGRQTSNLEQILPGRLRVAMERFGIENSRALILDPTGNIVWDSQPGLKSPPPAELEQAAVAESSFSGTYRGGLNRRMLYVTTPLQGGGAFILAAPRPVGLLGLGDELLTPVLRAAAVGLIVSVLLAFVLARWISAPLQKTARAAEAVAEGDYDQSLELVGPNETKSLAIAFNQMVSRVKASQLSMRAFVANVSHELKTPLTSIQGFSQAILDGAASDPEAQRSAAAVIYSEAGRMERMVDELLDLARLDAGQIILVREPVDLNLLLRGVLDRLSIKIAAKGVKVRSEIEGLPPIVGDGDRLSQVFTNLLDNAIRHSPENGRIVIVGRKDVNSVVLEVADQGPGIPVELQPRIFERFFRIDKARAGGETQGAGLGLAISKELIELHGGKIWVESEAGKGSAFYLRLPIIQPGDVTFDRRR
jgi:signal transduction histidine kinase